MVTVRGTYRSARPRAGRSSCSWSWGAEASGIVEGARTAGLDAARIHHVEDAEGALDVLRPRLRDGDAVLVKASRGVGLDRVVDALRLELGERPR